MDTTPIRTLWHASRSDIERPTIAGRTAGQNHGNSGLGIFCASGPHDYIMGFGETIFALDVKHEARVKQMTIQELAKMGQEQYLSASEQRGWFEAEGRRLAEHYDLIELQEHTGFVSQVIILRDDAIGDARKFSQDEFAIIATDVHAEMRQYEAQKDAQARKYIREELEQMDVDDLDRMAFGLISGDVIEIAPKEIKIIYPGDMENPQYLFETQGMEWARSVDLSEPVEISVDDEGFYNLENGHHRLFAAIKTNQTLKATVEIKGRPIERILAGKDQDHRVTRKLKP